MTEIHWHAERRSTMVVKCVLSCSRTAVDSKTNPNLNPFLAIKLHLFCFMGGVTDRPSVARQAQTMSAVSAPLS